MIAGLLGLVLGTTTSQAQGTWTQIPDTLDVLVALPFGLQVELLPGGFLPRKAGRLREIALESLHGVEAAARELAASGVPVRLNVVDEVPDSTGQTQIHSLDIARADLVVGPLMRENVAVVADRIDRFGSEHVLLTEQPDRYVQRGPAVRQAVASEWAAVEQLANVVASAHDRDNVMLVMTGNADAALEERFQTIFNAEQRKKWTAPGDSLRFALIDTVRGSARSVGKLDEFFTPYQRNVVVSVAGRSARSMWAALQTELQLNDRLDFVVYGHPDVVDMPFLEGALMESWRLTLPQIGVIDWSDSTLWESLMGYRILTGTEPQKYAILAHDALIDAAVRRFPQLNESVTFWAQPMKWSQPQERGAWVNQAWTMTRFGDLRWARLDTMPEVEPFVPRLFYDNMNRVIPVPPEYRYLFPDDYPKH